MKYKVEITEVLQKTIEIEASNKKEALQLVKDKYRKCEILLSSLDFIDNEFKIIEV